MCPIVDQYEDGVKEDPLHVTKLLFTWKSFCVVNVSLECAGYHIYPLFFDIR